jgi:putative ATP-dependent endonuclease of OLD family
MASKLHKLIIKNFRAIGSNPVIIDLNDIVVLVGPNNVGKSSILRAYELLMLDGSKEGHLTIEDFPEKKISKDKTPTLELHTIVDKESKPGDEWVKEIGDGTYLVMENWTWVEPGEGLRKGFNFKLDKWSEEKDKEKYPWGPANKANSFRPYPHRISAFATPEEQTDEFLKLLETIIHNKLNDIKGEEKSDYSKLIDSIIDLQRVVVEQGKEEIVKLEDELSVEISKIFPDYRVEFDPRHSEPSHKEINFFSENSELRVGPKNGFMSTIENQGSGSRRTLIWAALKLLSEKGFKARPKGSKKQNPDSISRERGKLLLMDEPEICLHPSAIREMKNTLYSLTEDADWQVMITTHSPQFIDLSKNNTTIIRVDKVLDSNEIQGTTLFRPDKVELGEDDKENLKYLNQFEPYLAEFFFGRKNIVVEGDTEFTAFNYLKAMYPKEYGDVHIIRARGKATIVSLIKILNHFGSDYAVLHDSDKPKLKSEKKNPAWKHNETILKEINAVDKNTKVRLVCSLPNFEVAFLRSVYKETKPYNALLNMKNEPDSFKEVKKLFDGLINHKLELPKNALDWNEINELEKKVNNLNAE